MSHTQQYCLIHKYLSDGNCPQCLKASRMLNHGAFSSSQDFPAQSQLPIASGWKCPVCENIYAPFWYECEKCNRGK